MYMMVAFPCSAAWLCASVWPRCCCAWFVEPGLQWYVHTVICVWSWVYGLLLVRIRGWNFIVLAVVVVCWCVNEVGDSMVLGSSE